MTTSTVAGGFELSRPRTVGRAAHEAAWVSDPGLEPSLLRIVAAVRRERKCVEEERERRCVEEREKMTAGRALESKFAGAHRTGRRQIRSPAVAAGLVIHVELETRERRLLPRRRQPLWEVLGVQAERRPSRAGPWLVEQGRFLACRSHCTRHVHRIQAFVLGTGCTRHTPLVMGPAFGRNLALRSHPRSVSSDMKPGTDRNRYASGCRVVPAFHMHLLPDQHPCSRWQRLGAPAVHRDFWRSGRQEWWRRAWRLATFRSKGVGSGRCSQAF